MKLYEIHSETRQAQPTAVCAATLTVAEIGPWLARIYGDIAEFLADQHAGPAGPPFARYQSRSDEQFAVEAGFPATKPIAASGEIQPSELPGGLVASTVHSGPYDEMKPGYQALESWVTDHGGEATASPWEVYLTDPSVQSDPENWHTEIVQPYRQT